MSKQRGTAIVRLVLAAVAAGAFSTGCFAQSAADHQTAPAGTPTSAANDNSLAAYWPFGLPPRTWDLVGKMGSVAMSVTYWSPDKEHLDLVFTHPLKKNVAVEGFNGGVQRYCDNNGDPYLFLDGYVAVNPDGSVEHLRKVVSSRIILTPEGGSPIDLIADGTYARCGNTGQPYLKWNFDIHRYRLQVWGYLAANPKNVWYWDVKVAAPVQTATHCGGPERPFTAVEVQESWWSNFNNSGGRWRHGTGEIGADGVPNGNNISYGRTDWHARGQMPWYMVVSNKGNAMCAGAATEGSKLPLSQLPAGNSP